MRGGSWGRCFLLGVMCILLGTQTAFGAGFALYEGSARGNAMGGAMIGRGEDASALYYNPAGITDLPGLQMMGGMTAIIPSTTVKTAVGTAAERSTDSETNVWLAPHFYTTYQINNHIWAGLAVFSPFGLGTEFDSKWSGKYNNYRAVIETVTINPNLAVKLSDKLSLAFGVEAMYMGLDLRQGVSTTLDQKLTGSSWGYGFNFGARYKIFDWLAAGVTYRSRVTQNLNGDAKYFLASSGTEVSAAATTVKGNIELPDSCSFGLTFYPTEKFSFELSGVWTGWSSYDQLQVTYANGRSVTLPKHWRDTIRFQFGAEYKLTNWLDLRAGYTYDEEPSPEEWVDYLVPANDRHLFSFGPGFRYRNWTLDLSYTYLVITDRDVSNSQALAGIGVLPSEFRNGDAHLFGISLGYKF